MKKVLAYGSAVLLLAVSAPAQESEKAKKMVQAGMKEYISAFKRRDWKGVERVYAKFFSRDYREVRPDGTVMDYKKGLEQMRQNMRMTRRVDHIDLKLLTFQVKGNEAVSKEQFTLKAIVMDFADPKKTAKMDFSATWTGMYRKINGRWMVTGNKNSKETMKINGKPFPPAPPRAPVSRSKG